MEEGSFGDERQHRGATTRLRVLVLVEKIRVGRMREGEEVIERG